MKIYCQYPCAVNRSSLIQKKEKEEITFLEIYPGIHMFSRIQRHPGNFHKSRIFWQFFGSSQRCLRYFLEGKTDKKKKKENARLMC